MARHEHDGRDGTARPAVADAFVDDGLGDPNCPVCLTRMEDAVTPSGEPYWRCATCGHRRLV